MGFRHSCRHQIHCRATHALYACCHTSPLKFVLFCVRCRNISDHYRTEKYFAAQSLDNQILIYSTDNFRQNRKKRFAGHSVAGYACQVGFSPDGKWISSGDGEGNVVFWDWKTGRIKSRMKAHSKVVIAHEWLPHETVGVIVQMFRIVLSAFYSPKS
jgi:WD40 repeat protein